MAFRARLILILHKKNPLKNQRALVEGILPVCYARLRESILEVRLAIKAARRGPRAQGNSGTDCFAAFTVSAMNFVLPAIGMPVFCSSCFFVADNLTPQSGVFEANKIFSGIFRDFLFTN